MWNPGLPNYAVAMLAVLGAVAVRLALAPILAGSPPLVLFTLSVMAAARFGGVAAGLLATVLSGLVGAYFFMAPYGSFRIESPAERAYLAMFGLAGTGISLASGQLRRALELSAKAGERYRTLSEATPHLVWTAGPDGGCNYVNTRWVDYTGIEAPRQTGFGWMELVHPEDRESVLGTWKQAVCSGGDFHMEFRLRRRDGAYRWFDAYAVALRDASGMILKWFGSGTDVHEAHEAREMLRYVSASLVTAQEEERRRISRELHDDLTQRLGLMAIDLGKMASRPPAAEALPEELRSLQERAVEAAELTRHIAHELHPSVLDDFGIEKALGSYCREFANREMVAVEFRGSNLPRTVKREAASCLYAVAQEALLNVAKHSRATSVIVELAGVDNFVRLTVSDDGVGFIPQSGAVGMGLGIVNMRERVRWLNGAFSIESEPGRGVRVRAEVPVGRTS